MKIERVEALRRRGTAGGIRHALALLFVVYGVVATLGCGPVETPAEPAETGSRSGALVGTNGLAFNGLAFNGLAFNGLAFNGLAFNGLSPEGLASDTFASWFRMNPDLAAQVMTYIVRCAVPAGQSRTYQDVLTGQSYTWEGSLGLAPDWASGGEANLDEQQVITACLAAHVNKFGVRLPISILGTDAKGAPIPYTAEELGTFTKPEACFFGNLFTGEGIFVGNNRGLMSERESTARACALSSKGESVAGECPPLTFTDKCGTLCTLDSSGHYFTRCTINGKSYRPITTRLRGREIYKCGDGICQFTESCGSNDEYDNCALDCGRCDGSGNDKGKDDKDD